MRNSIDNCWFVVVGRQSIIAGRNKALCQEREEGIYNFVKSDMIVDRSPVLFRVAAKNTIDCGEACTVGRILATLACRGVYGFMTLE